MARRRKKRRSRKRIFMAYMLRTICLLVLVGLIVGVVFIVKYFATNIGAGKANKSEFAENTIEISKKGNITGDIYEDFSAGYYDVNELSEMIDSEISDYNRLVGDSDAVKLSEYSVDEGIARVSIEYKDATEYRGFNSTELYVGKVEDLLAQGIKFDKNLIDVSDTTSFISSTDIESISDYNAVVVDENTAVVCPTKILYYTSNIELLDKNSGRAKAEGDYAVIIYK